MSTDEERRVVDAIKAEGPYGPIAQERLIRHLDPRHRGTEESEKFFEGMQNHPEVRRYRKSDGTYRWTTR
ncbi:MAG: hypothetical protein WB565_03795 [Acidimicrobiales bacterium]